MTVVVAYDGRRAHAARGDRFAPSVADRLLRPTAGVRGSIGGHLCRARYLCVTAIVTFVLVAL